MDFDIYLVKHWKRATCIERCTCGSTGDYQILELLCSKDFIFYVHFIGNTSTNFLKQGLEHLVKAEKCRLLNFDSINCVDSFKKPQERKLVQCVKSSQPFKILLTPALNFVVAPEVHKPKTFFRKNPFDYNQNFINYSHSFSADFLNHKLNKVDNLFNFFKWRFYYIKLIGCKTGLHSCKLNASFSRKNNNIVESPFKAETSRDSCNQRLQTNKFNTFSEISSPFFYLFAQVTKKMSTINRQFSLSVAKKLFDPNMCDTIQSCDQFVIDDVNCTSLLCSMKLSNKKDHHVLSNLGLFASTRRNKQKNDKQVKPWPFLLQPSIKHDLISSTLLKPKNTFGLNQSNVDNQYPYKIVEEKNTIDSSMTRSLGFLTENENLLNQENKNITETTQGFIRISDVKKPNSITESLDKCRDDLFLGTIFQVDQTQLFAHNPRTKLNTGIIRKNKLQEKYNKFHTLPIFSTYVYKEWSHRFSFLEYFVWSAKKNDLIVPFYLHRGTCHSARLHSINLIRNQVSLFTSGNNNERQLVPPLQPVQPLQPSVAQVAMTGRVYPFSANQSSIGKKMQPSKLVLFSFNGCIKKNQRCTTLVAKNFSQMLLPWNNSNNGSQPLQPLQPLQPSVAQVRQVTIPNQIKDPHFLELRNRKVLFTFSTAPNNLIERSSLQSCASHVHIVTEIQKHKQQKIEHGNIEQKLKMPFVNSANSKKYSLITPVNPERERMQSLTNPLQSSNIPICLSVFRRIENIFEWKSSISWCIEDSKTNNSIGSDYSPFSNKIKPDNFIEPSNLCKPVFLKQFENPLHGPIRKELSVGLCASSVQPKVFACLCIKDAKTVGWKEETQKMHKHKQAHSESNKQVSDTCDNDKQKNFMRSFLPLSQVSLRRNNYSTRLHSLTFNAINRISDSTDYKQLVTQNAQIARTTLMMDKRTDIIQDSNRKTTWGKIDNTQQFPRLEELLQFTGGTALRHLLSRFHLVLLGKFLRHELKNLELKVNFLLALKMLTYSQGLLLGKLAKRRSKQIRRLKLLELFQSKKSKPEWMILSILPVLPPDLRPILRVNDDFVVASDLNRLYQTVLRRNNTIHERLDDPLPCPESGLFRQRSLQKAVDGLLENGKGGGTPLCASKRRPLISLSNVLKGKKGLFRQHLLGKRVDYSGRSVIVVGPKLKLHECGLPKEMALELFQPFLIHKLKIKGLATSNTTARRMIQQEDPIIWHTVQQLVYEHPVLLNRAPTLHRLGIQAFQPRLVSGRAILLHPLVCNGFNADFDGDQMAVHVPLSFQARAEAWKIMWSKNNLLSPATGQPILVPSQDMVLGCYYLSVNIPRSCSLPDSKTKVPIFNAPPVSNACKKERLHVFGTTNKNEIIKTNSPFGYFKKAQHLGFLTNANLLQKPAWVATETCIKPDNTSFSSASSPSVLACTRKRTNTSYMTSSKTLVKKVGEQYVCCTPKECNEFAIESPTEPMQNQVPAVITNQDFIRISGAQERNLMIDVKGNLEGKVGILACINEVDAQTEFVNQRYNISATALMKNANKGNSLSGIIGKHVKKGCEEKESLLFWRNIKPLTKAKSGMQFSPISFTSLKISHSLGGEFLENSCYWFKQKSEYKFIKNSNNTKVDTNNRKIDPTLNSAYRLKRGHYFSNFQDGLMAFYQGRLQTHTSFWVRLNNSVLEKKKEINVSQKKNPLGFFQPVQPVQPKVAMVAQVEKTVQYETASIKLEQPQQKLISFNSRIDEKNKLVLQSLLGKKQRGYTLFPIKTAQPKLVTHAKTWTENNYQENHKAETKINPVQPLQSLQPLQPSVAQVAQIVQVDLILQPRYGPSRQLSKVLFQEDHFKFVMEGNENLEAPLEVRLSAISDLVQIFTTFQNHYSCDATILEQYKEKSIRYICTTAGRIVINDKVINLVNKNVS